MTDIKPDVSKARAQAEGVVIRPHVLPGHAVPTILRSAGGAGRGYPNAPRASRSTPNQHREEGQQSKDRDEWTGRIPNRSGMTTVAFQGQGGGLPAAEWTLASVLKTAGYQTFFTGKWHLGEADYALPNTSIVRETRQAEGPPSFSPFGKARGEPTDDQPEIRKINTTTNSTT